MVGRKQRCGVKLNKDRIKQFLPLVGSIVSSAQNRSGWVLGSCPYAPWKHDGGIDKHPSFAVSVKDTGVSRYNCFSCNSHGDLSDMLLELRQRLGKGNHKGYDFTNAMQLVAHEEDEFDLVIKDYKEEVESEEGVVVFPEWWLDSFIPAVKSKKAMAYLHGRGVCVEIAHWLDLRYDSQRERVCFPIRDWDGFLVGLHGRAISDNVVPPYYAYGYKEVRNKLPWLGEAWIDLDKPVLLVESVFDLASVIRVYKNSMCSLSCGLSYKKVKRIADAGDIITLYDYGKGGDTARHSLTKYLSNNVILTHRVPTEAEGDPGNMIIPRIKEEITGFLC